MSLRIFKLEGAVILAEEERIAREKEVTTSTLREETKDRGIDKTVKYLALILIIILIVVVIFYVRHKDGSRNF